ncbi:isochorismatase family protein [Nocardia altamirensis]|uniref:isochorismatase family protein n=1 Tax=Nocardia altamirensis TaxID=472158 RepID=UPI0008403AEC|nr:isochorismatase family protein [Nocardia altamirensis]
MSEIAPVDALLVVDVQSAFFEGQEAIPYADAVKIQIAALIARARLTGAFVAHLQNDGGPGAVDEPGTDGWQLLLPVQPGPREAVVHKATDDGFDGTELNSLLVERGVNALAIGGVQSEMCVLATARTALDHGYRVVLPHDAHGTYDIPPAPGDTEGVPAKQASRVAEWALGDEVEVIAHAKEVEFRAIDPTVS